MSMPSSSDAVATSALSVAALQPLLGVEPKFLGEAAVVRGDLFLAELLGRDAGRRARPCRRVLTNTSVVRCARDQLGQALVDSARLLVATSPPPAATGGSSSARSRCLAWPMSTMRARSAVGRAAAPTRKRGDRLDRLLGRRQADARQAVAGTALPAAPATAPGGVPRLFARARGSRRRSPCARSRAWRGRNPSRSRTYSDSGVVTRMCGGVLRMRVALGLRRVPGAYRGADRRRRAGLLARARRGCLPAAPRG